MIGNGTSKKLPCNHIFHVACLRSWFQRQQTCPTCRMDILRIPNNQQGSTNQQHNQARNVNQQNLNNNANGNNNNIQGAAGGAQMIQPPAGAAGPQTNVTNHPGGHYNPGGSHAQGSSIGGANMSQQAQSIVAASLQNEMTAVMIHVFAQMFVQAMLTHLRTLNQQQSGRNQQQQPRQQQDSNEQTNIVITADASTQTDTDEIENADD